MNTFAIIFVVLYGLGIASAQLSNLYHEYASPLIVPCEALNHGNLTWTCQKQPCRGYFPQERHTSPFVFSCNSNDLSERCCPDYPEYKGETNERNRNRPEVSSFSNTPRTPTLKGTSEDTNYHFVGKEEANVAAVTERNRNRPEFSSLPSTPRTPTIKGTSEDEDFSVADNEEAKVVATTKRNRNNKPEFSSFPSTPHTTKVKSTSSEEELLLLELQSPRFSKFDRDLLFELSKQYPNKNVIVSPASIKSLLALLVEASSDETAAEILRALQLNSGPKERPKSILLLRKLQSLVRNNRTSISLESENRIYRAQNVTIKEEYEQILSSVYHTGIEPVDFSKPDQVANSINNWVRNSTHGFIPRVIEENNIHKDAKLFLLNYIYMKASWDLPFNPLHTTPRCFYPPGNKCQEVKFMKMKRLLNYTDSVEFNSEIFEIPFKDPRYTIVFVLPHKETNVHDVLKSLERKNLFRLFNKLQEESINLALPRTVIGFYSNLVNPLQQLKIKSVFERSAKLTNMLRNNAHFSVTDIVHKARIELNEEGAEAAGVSGANIQTLSLDVDRNVGVDRPFLFFIRDTAVNGFLFEGMVFSPDPIE